MVCYNNKQKIAAGKCVGGFSVVTLLLGLLTLLYGASKMGDFKTGNEWAGTTDFIGSWYGMILAFLGVVTILIGALGIATWKCKSGFITLPFICLTLIVGFSLLAFGLVTLAASTSFSDIVQQEVCSKNHDDIKDGLVEFNEKYNEAVQQYVCSQECPCPAGKNDVNKKLWESYDEDLFEHWGRSKQANVKNGLYWTTGKGYGSFKQCWDEVLSKKVEAVNSTYPEKRGDHTDSDSDEDYEFEGVNDFMRKGGLEFFSQLESSYQCAGLCDTTLFYVTLDISEGKPNKDCFNVIYDEIQQQSNVPGMIGFLTGLLLLISMCAAFPLCTGLKKEQQSSTQMTSV